MDKTDWPMMVVVALMGCGAGVVALMAAELLIALLRAVA